MTGMTGGPGFAGEWSGGRFGEQAFCVLAPNPGPMTLDGTNTWVIGAAGSGVVTVVDPGPDSEVHWRAVSDHVASEDARVGLILLTHGHADHSEGARLFAEHARCEVRALDPLHQFGGEGLTAGEVIALGGSEIRVISTPGHSADSLSFQLTADRALLTGDTILGRGTTVVAHPDGRLDDYLDSLHHLRDLACEADLSVILPGHGPVLDQPAAAIEGYLQHRHQRLDQVRAAVADIEFVGGDELQLAQAVVETVYADVSRAVWPAALLSVLAQLEYLKAGH
jgi:glyoxylase-like metal-dependent hydrolase (beta-lactamase superfamily II)